MGGNSLQFVVGRGGEGLVISRVRAAAYGISPRGYLGGCLLDCALVYLLLSLVGCLDSAELADSLAGFPFLSFL